MSSRYFNTILFLFFSGTIACNTSRKSMAAGVTDGQMLVYSDTAINFDKKLVSGLVRADLEILRKTLEEAQTSIYTYSSKKQVDKAFNTALQKTKVPVSYLEFIGLISKIQHTIACGHSSWEHSAQFLKYRDKQLGLFPFDIVISDDKYYIKRNYSLQADIPEYTELSHINGIPVKKITQQLKAYMNRDGFSGPRSTTELQEYFKMAYSNFIGNPPAFDLHTRDGKTYNIQPLLLPVIDSIKRSRYGPETRPQPLRFSIIDSSNTAVYTIMRFSNEVIRRMGQEFVPFTDSVFRVLKERNIEKLVIDLRGNRGGWTANGVHLFSYFIRRPLPYIKRVETKKYEHYSFESLITEPAGYDDTMTLVHNGKYYEWKNNPNLMAYPAKQNRFDGKVYILVDGFTRSASSIFCALMREHTKAIIIGEELTAAHCGTSGMVTKIKLPYSGVTISFSTARYSFAVSDSSDTHGLKPDVAVSPGISDIRSGRDVYMETVLKK